MLHGECGVGQQHHLLAEGVLVLGQLLVLLGLSLGVFLLVLTVFPLVGLCGSAFLVVLGGLLALLFLEAFVGFLQERHVVVQCLQVELSVQRDAAVVLYGVAERGAVVQLGAAHPAVSGVVGQVKVGPVQYGQLVQRHLVRGGERLAVV